MNIGIIGYGIVGKAVEVGFRDQCTLYINDPKYDASIDKATVIKNCAYIFVGVPTPFNQNTKKAETSIIDGVITELNKLANNIERKVTIIIKSAIVPSKVREWINTCKNLNIVISPEYLTERSFKRDFVNQKVMILGGDKKICEDINQLYQDYSICNKACKVGYCTAEEAALIKYMENSFLAMKNIFNNQFKFFYDKFFDTKNHDGFNGIMDIFYLDERMGLFPFKYRVPGPDGDFGYGGKCLPKDVLGMIGEAAEVGVDLSLMKKVNEINDKIRTDRDWEHIEGALA